MKNLQCSEERIKKKKSECSVGYCCADRFSIGIGISIKLLTFTANRTSKTYLQDVYCTRRKLTELLSERTPFLTEIIT